MIEGFLDAVEPYQVRGWAFDSSCPIEPLTVEILLNNRLVGTVTANLYRRDLQEGSIGTGDHAFILNFDHRLDHKDVDAITARVVRQDGSYYHLLAPSPVAMPTPVVDPPARQMMAFPGVVADNTQHPVFILGAARSGTSAMAQAILKLDRYQGHQEGHLLDLLAHWTVGLNKFYVEKGDDTTGERDTSIACVQEEFFQNALNEIFINTATLMFPRGYWVDKTPNSDMVHLAPRFRKMWPNARFIFMKRRFLENSQSRARKFPTYGYKRNCREWSDTMAAWRDVRESLHGAAIEIDQHFLCNEPAVTAGALQRLLNLSDVDAAHLTQAFSHDRPERTSDIAPTSCDISKMDWTPDARREFDVSCAGLMDIYGYSTDSRYYQSGSEINALMLV